MPRTRVRRLLLLTGVIVALAGVIVPLSAGSGTKTGFNDGPYAASTPDSGTCGPNWAVDLFTRNFNTTPHNDGSFTVVQTFKNAKFITLGDGQGGPGTSPGACNSGPDNGNK